MPARRYHSGSRLCIIPPLFGVPVKNPFHDLENIMSDMGTQEVLSRKLLALFLIGGSLGAIIMSWIAYAQMIGRAM